MSEPEWLLAHRSSELVRTELLPLAYKLECGSEGDFCGLCAIASWALYLVLRNMGVGANFCVGIYDKCNHSFVLLRDGTIVDPTAGQFKEMPAINMEPLQGSKYKVNQVGGDASKELRHWDEQNPFKYSKKLERIARKVVEQLKDEGLDRPTASSPDSMGRAVPSDRFLPQGLSA